MARVKQHRSTVVISCTAPVDLDESVSVEISFSMPWSEFCLLRDYFKTKLAEELIDDDWQTISPSRVVLHDIDKRCAPKQKANDQVEDLVVFISEPGPSADKVDVAMTQKTYKVLHHVWKNRIDGPLGAVFRNKVSLEDMFQVTSPPTSDNEGSSIAHSPERPKWWSQFSPHASVPNGQFTKMTLLIRERYNMSVSIIQLLPDLQITNVEAEGVEAPAKPSGLSETSRTFVAIGIAVAVIAAILIVMGIVVSDNII